MSFEDSSFKGRSDCGDIDASCRFGLEVEFIFGQARKYWAVWSVHYVKLIVNLLTIGLSYPRITYQNELEYIRGMKKLYKESSLYLE